MSIVHPKASVLGPLHSWLQGKHVLKALPFVVTGSSGFIGSNVTSALSALGFDVIGLDLEMPHAVLTQLLAKPNFQFLKVNLCEADSVRKVAKKLPEKFVLIHLASPNTEHSASTNKGNKRQFLGYSTQIELELDIAKNLTSILCDRASHIIYGSSIDIFGSRPNPSGDYLINEDTHPSPDSPYGFGKFLSENMLREDMYARSIPLTIFRLPQIYGDYEFLFYQRAIPVFLSCVLDKKAIPLVGNALESRQYLHCNDVLLACFRSILADYQGTLQLCGEAVSLLRILDTLEKITGVTVRRDVSDKQREPQYEYILASEKAYQEIGFKQSISLESGLRSALHVAGAAR